MSSLSLKHRIKSIIERESGSATIESVLILPFLVLTWVLMIMLFDYIYESNVNQTAANTMADLVSRQTEEITPDWIANAAKLNAFVSQRDEDQTGLRITVLQYRINDPKSNSYNPDKPERYYDVKFSVFRGGAGVNPTGGDSEYRYRDEDFEDIQTSPFGEMLPHVGYGNYLIIVETYRLYKNQYITFLKNKLYGRAMSIPRYSAAVTMERN